MKILEYSRLDIRHVEPSYRKVIAMLKRNDFRSAEVKKLKPTSYYRAKLDYRNRLLFKIVTYCDEQYALILEVIRQHAYDKSSFLKGAHIQEHHLVKTPEDITSEAINYLNDQQPNLHRLDKLISFDDAQYSLLPLPCPLIIIGSAGSGKTALTLEKMKHYSGDIAYITHSAYLVHHARSLYHANLEDTPEQQVTFLSYQEFIETIEVPAQQEITFAQFSHWLSKFMHSKLARDPHTLYEEFRGVISGTRSDKPYLTQEEYLNLGVKQSVFPPASRLDVYQLYEKYRQFLVDINAYDINLMSYDYLDKITPAYDMVVVDEIQDFTNIQLLLILKSLRQSDQFILCGDSNQIVHPNFFSWSKIKTLCYQDDIATSQQITRILQTNYRCAENITTLANAILKIKQARFGSIDKESNYLVKSQAAQQGGVYFLPESDKRVATLNTNSQQSTHYAVIVLRDALKEKAKRLFQTPLVFSVHEAKGLEYDNIILYDAISSEAKAFMTIASGLTSDVIHAPLHYARGKDKTDRSLEMYKFYINALYVAITRGVKKVYWVESVRTHPLFDLLSLKEMDGALAAEQEKSSSQEWQQEARKLELQGKQEQADAIRAQLVKGNTLPWEVLTSDKTSALQAAALSPNATKQSKIELLEYALVYQQDAIRLELERRGLKAAANPQKSLGLIQRKYYDDYTSTNLNTAKRYIELYGVDVRNRFNQTLLMVGAYVGNHHLVRLVLGSGANTNLLDNNQHTAFQIALRRALFDSSYLRTKLGGLYTHLAADSVDIEVDNKLVKIDVSSAEYLLFHIVYLLFDQTNTQRNDGRVAVICVQNIMRAVEHFPAHIVPDYRKKRAYLSSILAKNEVHGNDRYNRKLFERIRRGYYRINPKLKVKMANRWMAVAPDESRHITQCHPVVEHV